MPQPIIEFKTRIRNLRAVQFAIAVSVMSLLLALCVGCAAESTQASQQPPPSATELPVTPTTALPPDTTEGLMPAGWLTYTSQQCEYAIGFPPEMQVTNNGQQSRTIGFSLANPEDGARNFIYVSVINPEIPSVGEEGVYNYAPEEAEVLLSIQVGESKALREVPNAEPWTYQRKPDTSIGVHAAQTYENLLPWEFPAGTKEIRYYLSLNGCTYLIGGYMDTTGSDRPGVITEDLFSQIVATIHLLP